jgi:spore coat protein JC
MWIYEKKLQYPVKIARPNARLAGMIIDALGGPDGELGASMRYLNQRYIMPSDKVIGLLTDIGSEELGHMEIVAAIVYQLTRNLTPDEIIAGGFDKYYIGHGDGIYPSSAAGVPFNATAISSKGDALCDLNEDLAAEQKARITYDNILRLSDDPDVNDVIKFLRQREIVHYQRFGEAIRIVMEK